MGYLERNKNNLSTTQKDIKLKCPDCGSIEISKLLVCADCGRKFSYFRNIFNLPVAVFS